MSQNALRLAHREITDLEAKLQAAMSKLADLESSLVSIQANRRAASRSKGKNGPAPARTDDTFVPDHLKEKRLRVDAEGKRIAKHFVFFWSPYTPDHIFKLEGDVQWHWYDVSQRYNDHFPGNREKGDALDLRACAGPPNSEVREWVETAYTPFVKEFFESASDERSQAIQRVRQNGTELFVDIKGVINLDCEALRAVGEVPEIKRRGAPPQPVNEYDAALFSADGYECRRKFRKLMVLIGVVETSAGVFASDPWCAIIYETYEKDGGQIFVNMTLFFVARCLIYGRTAIKKTNPVLNRNNPLYGGNLRATPGLIAFICILVRISLSPDCSFTNDGEGPITKISYVTDFEQYKQFLMTVWGQPTGKAICDAWNKNVFPSRTTTAASTPSMPQPAQPPIQQPRSESVAEAIARHNLAMRSRESAPAADAILNRPSVAPQTVHPPLQAPPPPPQVNTASSSPAMRPTVPPTVSQQPSRVGAHSQGALAAGIRYQAPVNVGVHDGVEDVYQIPSEFEENESFYYKAPSIDEQYDRTEDSQSDSDDAGPSPVWDEDNGVMIEGADAHQLQGWPAATKPSSSSTSAGVSGIESQVFGLNLGDAGRSSLLQPPPHANPHFPAGGDTFSSAPAYWEAPRARPSAPPALAIARSFHPSPSPSNYSEFHPSPLTVDRARLPAPPPGPPPLPSRQTRPSFTSAHPAPRLSPLPEDIGLAGMETGPDADPRNFDMDMDLPPVTQKPRPKPKPKTTTHRPQLTIEIPAGPNAATDPIDTVDLVEASVPQDRRPTRSSTRSKTAAVPQGSAEVAKDKRGSKQKGAKSKKGV